MLKRILETLQKIEKQLSEQEKLQKTQPQRVSQAVLPSTTTSVTPAPVSKEAVIEAQQEARELVLEAKDEALKIKKEAEEEVQKLRSEALDLEKRIAVKEENLDRKIGALEEREKQLLTKQDELDLKNRELEKIKQEQLAKLERVASLSKDEAKKLILEATKQKLQEEVAKEIRESENTAKEEADKRARTILVEAMQKAATDYVAEYTVSVVKITDEEIKGRIIGKEGRNIRAFEQATGVDVDLDETPNEIRLSSFDSVRREIARVALERLIADGRIQPVKIEEIVQRTKEDLEKVMFTEGEKLCHAVGVYNLPHDLIAHLGKFKYRFSYGQNMIAHTMEETKIGVALAHEVGADVNVVRLGCLLHDIGKVITDKEGTHVTLGVELLKKYNLPQAVIDCVASHHEDTAFTSIDGVLVYIADAISGARPGARYEDYDQYVKRLTDLEGIAKEKKGVETAFAFQAGRELRIIVQPENVSDNEALIISKEVAREIEEKIKNYPGQIKVTVIREFRATELAK
ncbi:ribonuclease Y [Candidatus Microgenomates bacterium]|nr:ribonuclease Y [Candidatus Microgenomates bacterium]